MAKKRDESKADLTKKGRPLKNAKIFSSKPKPATRSNK